MLPLKKIVCPTDFSEPAGKGIDIASELAEQFSAELLLVHVIEYFPNMHAGIAPPYMTSVLKEMQATAESLLDKIRKERIPKDIPVRIFVIQGKASNAIVDLANKENADIIVIPTHGESGWEQFVFGSVTEKVVRFAECPVLTIRSPGKE